MTTRRGVLVTAAALGAGLLTGCRTGDLPGRGDTGPVQTCAIPPRDPWAEAAVKQLTGTTVKYLPRPTEARERFEAIAVAELRGDPDPRDGMLFLSGTVVDAVQGARARQRLRIVYPGFGVRPQVVADLLATVGHRVLVFWGGRNGEIASPEGLWYELPIMGCDRPVGRTVSNPAHGIGAPTGWGEVTSLDGLVEALRGDSASGR